MDEKTILEGILWDLKVLGDLSLHGSIESGTKEVHKMFVDSLNEVLIMQNDLYNLMASNGMYKVNNIEEKKIEQSKKNYKPNLKED